MPNYAQAAIQLRQNKERRAKERGSKRQAPGENNYTDQNNASAIKIQTPGDIRQLNAAKNVRKRRQTYSVPPKELPESGTLASLVLYSGLVLAATGLVITAVGLGDKGFRSRELRLLGPGIMLSGVGLTMLRILMCCVASSSCFRRLRVGRVCEACCPCHEEDTNTGRRVRGFQRLEARAVTIATSESERFLLQQDYSCHDIERLKLCDR